MIKTLSSLKFKGFLRLYVTPNTAVLEIPPLFASPKIGGIEGFDCNWLKLNCKDIFHNNNE